MLVSCQEDDVIVDNLNRNLNIENGKNTHGFLNKYIPINTDEFSKSNFFSLVYSQESSQNSRSTLNGYSIVDSLLISQGLEFTNKDTTFYTIPYKYVTDEESFYNLHLIETSNDVVAYKIKYTRNLNHSQKFLAEAKVFNIDITNNNFNPSECYAVDIFWESSCNGGANHMDPDECPCGTVQAPDCLPPSSGYVTHEVCPEYPGVVIPGLPGSIPSGGGGGNPPTVGNPTTTPIQPMEGVELIGDLNNNGTLQEYEACNNGPANNCWQYCDTYDCETFGLDQDQAIYDCVNNTGDCHEVFCNEIDEQINHPDFSSKADALKNNFNLQYETGYLEQLDGSFIEGNATSNGSGGHSLKYDDLSTPNTIGFMHTHINNYTRNLPWGGTELVQPIHMHSPQDILFFLQLILTSSVTGTGLHEVYGSMYSSSGNYTIKFSGDTNDIATNLATLSAQKTKLNTIYKKYFNLKNPGLNEKGLLKFIEEQVGIDGIELFQINDDGTVEQKKLNANGDVESIPC